MTKIVPQSNELRNSLLFVEELQKRCGKRWVRCVCTGCGNNWEGVLYDWWYGYTKSCGCLQLQTVTSHGRSRTREYKVWEGMLARCYNPNNRRYGAYGGRGITVCEQWRSSFAEFFADMGTCPHPNAQLDRKNNNLGYEPNNCYWTSQTLNQRNTRQSKVWTINGVAYESSRHAASCLGVSSTTIRNWCKSNKPGFSVRMKYARLDGTNHRADSRYCR